MTGSSASQNTPTTHPAMRGVSRVYVEIPPSPYSRVKQNAKSHVSESYRLKENTAPLQSTVMRRDAGEKVITALPSAHKRKASTLAAVSNQKKPKISGPEGAGAQSTPLEKQIFTVDAQHSQNKDTLKEFPNGYNTCHQCRAKREPTSEHRTGMYPTPFNSLRRLFTMHRRDWRCCRWQGTSLQGVVLQIVLEQTLR